MLGGKFTIPPPPPHPISKFEVVDLLNSLAYLGKDMNQLYLIILVNCMIFLGQFNQNLVKL